ncbi:MAG: nucleic acid-binding protein [Armatimonadetes bacterium]|nr:nucleic acid-binding protein [Armatimonadota bacterium]
MPTVIILDTGVLSNCVVPLNRGRSTNLSLAEACREWLADCEQNGATILVCAVAYYEALCEIERRQAVAQRTRLVTYCFQAGRFIPLNTSHLEAPAFLWAQARNVGLTTANDAALDGDVLLCAQVQSLGFTSTDYVVATTNTKHLSRFVNADEWQNISPTL